MSCTQGLFWHVTASVPFLETPSGLQSLVAFATTSNGTWAPDVQAGIVKSFVYCCVTPAATGPLNTCVPLMVTRMFSGSSEQFFTVPDTVMVAPGQAAA